MRMAEGIMHTVQAHIGICLSWMSRVFVAEPIQRGPNDDIQNDQLDISFVSHLYEDLIMCAYMCQASNVQYLTPRKTLLGSYNKPKGKSSVLSLRTSLTLFSEDIGHWHWNRDLVGSPFLAFYCHVVFLTYNRAMYVHPFARFLIMIYLMFLISFY